MKRSAKKPNIVWQEIKNLKPGRLYSLKMVTADYGELMKGESVKQKHAVSIRLDNVEQSLKNASSSLSPTTMPITGDLSTISIPSG
jgi:hypothetical protein